MNMSPSWLIDERENRLHATAIVGSDVVLGSRNVIGALSVIGGMGCTVQIGDDNSFGVGCVIGSPAESASGYPGSAHLNFQEWSKNNSQFVQGVTVGSKCVIRDRVTIHAGIDESTLIGDLNYLHSNCHIDHDCRTGRGVVLAPNVVIGGRVVLGDFCQIGLGACLHQGSAVGALSMLGMNSTLKGSIPEMCLYFGSPARYRGPNTIRLRRLGLTDEGISVIRKLLETRSLTAQDKSRLKTMTEGLINQSTADAFQAWSIVQNE